MTGLAFDIEKLSVREVHPHDDAADFLDVFNSNPDFLDANTLHTDVTAFTDVDVEKFLWHNTVMENSHCLVVRAGERVVGTVTLLVPHPGERQPWLGSFVMHTGDGLEPVGEPVLTAMELELSRAGWTSVFVGPMVSQTETIAWWRSQGYRPVEVRLDNDKREVEVHRKDLLA